MKCIIQVYPIERRESGEIVSRATATMERNGAAIWYEREGFTPRLLAFRYTEDRPLAFAWATDQARTIAREASLHGEHFAADRRFTQC